MYTGDSLKSSYDCLLSSGDQIAITPSESDFSIKKKVLKKFLNIMASGAFRILRKSISLLWCCQKFNIISSVLYFC